MRMPLFTGTVAGKRSLTLYISRLVLISAILLLAGCSVTSVNKTRSFMTEDEIAEIDAAYTGVEVEPEEPEVVEEEETPERVLEPFMQDIGGPALTVNGIPIHAEDIRALYEYYGTFREEDDITLKQEAVAQWILAYSVMSQWPDTIEPARDRMIEIREQLDNGVEFDNLIMENSQDPLVGQNRGDLGEIRRGDTNDIFEMHAMTDPILEVVGPFPDIFGWHMIKVLGRVTPPDEPDVLISNPQHLILFHGLNPANGQVILENLQRYRNTADIRIFNPEIQELMPWLED